MTDALKAPSWRRTQSIYDQLESFLHLPVFMLFHDAMQNVGLQRAFGLVF